MARIRHGYTQITPLVAPYFTTATHDDIDTVLAGYGTFTGGALSGVLYGMTTSLGMVGLIVAMVGGVLASVLALLAGLSGELAVWVGVAGAAVVFAAVLARTLWQIPRQQAALEVRFPAGPEPKPDEAAS